MTICARKNIAHKTETPEVGVYQNIVLYSAKLFASAYCADIRNYAAEALRDKCYLVDALENRSCMYGSALSVSAG